MPQISERICEDLLLRERALWTALTSGNPGPAVLKMCSPEANLLFPQMPILTVDGDNKILQEMEGKFHRFDNYSLDEVRPIVIDLMAGVVTYKVTAARGSTAYNASASTTWGQGSDGEWKIFCHQETLI